MENITRICKGCHKEIQFENLAKDKRHPDGVLPWCKPCKAAQVRKAPSYDRFRLKNNEKYRLNEACREERKAKAAKYRDESMERVLWHKLRTRSRKMGVVCDLEESDIIVPKFCPLTNIPISRGASTPKDNSPSVDRIDNSKGYVKGNIRVISYLANRMKSNANRDQLFYFSDHIKEYMDSVIKTD